MERVRSKAKQGVASYFATPAPDVKFFSSGCTLFDLVLGGGWPLGRISNTIGDKSTGKTLLAIEACANFAATFPKGVIWYRETEAAFDEGYAAALGMPIKRIDFGNTPIRTVEELFVDLQECIKQCTGSKAKEGLYVLDSLDAISDKAEMERDIDKGSFGASKAAQMSETFRRLNQDVAKANIHVFVVSQIRDKIGAMFGEKTTRSGGRALDFYASQITKLAHLKTLVQTVKGQKLPTGVRIKAKNTKNKVGLFGRECEFVIRFGFGVESFEASLEWLIATKQTKEFDLTEAGARALIDESLDWDSATLRERNAELDVVVRRVWAANQVSILPTRSKYGD